MGIRFLLIVVGCWFVNLAFAQDLFMQIERDSTAQNGAYLDVELVSYLKNNEYFGDFSEGFTSLGFYINPQVRYKFSDKLNASFGVHVSSVNGTNDFRRAYPFFQLDIQAAEHLQILVGKTSHSSTHELSQIVFQKDRWFQEPIELGFQILSDHEDFEFDTWLNWEKHIEFGDRFNEEFVFGNRSKMKVYRSSSFTLSVPFYWLLIHSGGQINERRDKVSTDINYGFGANLSYAFNSNMNIEIFGVKHHFTHSGENGLWFPRARVEGGDGYELGVKYKYKNFEWSGSYWTPKTFIARRGLHLINSTSDYNQNILDLERALVFTNLKYENKLNESVRYMFDFDGYYDLDRSHFDFGIGVFFKLDLSFVLGKKVD